MQFKLVDSIQWMDEREEHVLRQLRLISQIYEFYLLYISSCCRNYRVATVTKDWLLDTICSHEIKPVAGDLLLSKCLHHNHYSQSILCYRWILRN